MRQHFILIVFLALTLNSFSQETKFILKRNNDYNEEYYVLKNDKNIKQGSYVKYKMGVLSGIIILEAGEYINGQKNGQWEYFYDASSAHAKNNLKEKGSFVNGKKNGIWTTYYRDTIPDEVSRTSFGTKKRIDSISFNIDQKAVKLRTVGMYLNDKRVGEWISFSPSGTIAQKYNFTTSTLIYDLTIEDSLKYNTNRKPLFIGGYTCLIDFLNTNLNLLSILTQPNVDSTYATITFTINKQGSPEDFNVISNSKNEYSKKELIRLFASTDQYWLPGLKDGIPINDVYKVRFDMIIDRGTLNESKRLTLSFKTLE